MVPLQDGVRLSPTSVLDEKTLQISRIDTLFGPAKVREVIPGNG